MGLILATTLFLHATLLDGTGGAPLADSCLETTDGRITRIARASDCRVGPGARVVDLTGKWIVPGLIDTHTHLFDSGSLYTSPDDFDLTERVPHAEERARIRSGIDATLQRYLCSGVTTVASLGGPRWELEVRDATPAPHVLTAGPFYAGFEVGAMTLWTEDDPVLVRLESAEQARAAVERIARRGVDLVKAGFVSEPVLATLVAEAHSRGLRVVLHAEELEDARRAVAAGVDVLAHTVVDRVVDDAFLRAAAASGVVSITGLAHFARYRDVLEGTVSLLPVEERCGDPAVIATWDDLEDVASPPPMPESIRWGSSYEAHRILLENVKRMHDAGIPIAAGSNGGNVGTLQGPSYHRELVMLTEAGLSPAEVLVAATRDAARALGVYADRGTLELGKACDLVVLTEDPRADVAHLASVERVVVAGELVYP